MAPIRFAQTTLLPGDCLGLMWTWQLKKNVKSS